MLTLTQDCENNKRSNIDNLIKRDIIVNNKWESITFRMVSGEVGRVKDQLEVLMHILSVASECSGSRKREVIMVY